MNSQRLYGLSPRMRGNRDQNANGGDIRRSIPAYAGEPDPNYGFTPAKKVYPRVCGGTPARKARSRVSTGLSPRMRGNPPTKASGQMLIRSIPAYAGEPADQGIRPDADKVYPRVCGGTKSRQGKGKECEGLSPRMRGNRL